MSGVIAKVWARSASDKTDDWPFWMVWDGTKNVTAPVAKCLGIDWKPGAVFSSRAACEAMCLLFNEKRVNMFTV